MNNEKRNKHMTLDDRFEIQECLNKGMTFKAIGQRIEKNQTTVSKEVKLHGKVHANDITMKEIQEWLGHSNISTTANIYAHVDSESKRESARIIDRVLAIGYSQ